MKNIRNQFKINSLTYWLIFISLLSGLFKNIILIILIVVVHEFGHVFMVKLLGYETLEIQIYPFGGITKIKKDLNSPINHDLIIASGGFIFQIILSIIFIVLLNLNFITDKTFNIFKTYNFSILFFNLLPIMPLDGYVIIKSLLEKILSIKWAHYITVSLSVIFILLYLQYNYIYSLNNYMITFFLFYKTYVSIKNYNYIYNRFLLERYLKKYNYKKIRYLNNNNCNYFHRETFHIFKTKKEYIGEDRVLREKFDKIPRF